MNSFKSNRKPKFDSLIKAVSVNNFDLEKLSLGEDDRYYQKFLSDPSLSEAISNYYYSMK